MLTLPEFSSIVFSIKHCLLSIKACHVIESDNTDGWSSLTGKVEVALKNLDKLEMLGVSLRDHIALSATEDDIQEFKQLVPEINRAVPFPNGEIRVITGIPITWRATARYLYADAMLEARKPKEPPKN